MSKRRADKTLTKDNWDEEDAPEESGEFERASEEVIAKRTIRKAKRTLTTTNNAPRASPFAGFSFFENGGSNPPGSTATSMTTPTVSSSNGNRTSDEYLSKVAKLNRDILGCITRLMGNGAYLDLTPCFEDYMKHFQRLTREEEDRQRKNNNGLVSHSPPQPVSAGTSVSESSVSPAKAPTEAPKQTFSFDTQGVNKTSMFGGTSSSSFFKVDSPSKPTNAENSNSEQEFQFAKPVEPIKKFSFGLPSPAVIGGSESGTPNFNRDSLQTSMLNTQPLSGFGNSLGGSKPFSFGLGSTSSSGFQGFGTSSTLPAAGGSETTKDDDEEEQPPKVDIAPVGDEGSLYSKKVKLFYKKKVTDDKGAFAEKGVGFLHIFKLEDGAHQLLVRAQTALGNVLLNIRLGKNLPVSRLKNTNVAIVCVPNPPLDPKSADKTPTMFLIRVKSKEDADELYDKLVEFKGAV